MTSLRPRRPSLFILAADGRTLRFRFAPCAACGQLNFPANAPGCQRCGETLAGATPIEQPGIATLREAVGIHLAIAPGIEPPLTIGRFELAPGVVEEGVIRIADANTLQPGIRMQAVAQPLPDGETYGCAFEPVEGEAA